MIDRLDNGILRLGILLQETLAARLRRQEGQAFVEYALVLALVAVAVALIAAWKGLRDQMSTTLNNVVDTLKNAGS